MRVPAMAMSNKPSKPEFHTPEELLYGAHSLCDAGGPIMQRAAVLEAFGALDAFVRSLVDAALDRRLDQSLAVWLKKRHFNIDELISVLAPYATGLPPMTESPRYEPVWREFKRNTVPLRNRVAHRGARVDSSRADAAIENIQKVIEYFSITAQVLHALINFREYFTSGGAFANDEVSAARALKEYFAGLPAVEAVSSDIRIDDRRADIVLRVQGKRVLLEAKFARIYGEGVNKAISLARDHGRRLLRLPDVAGVGMVLFVRGDIPEGIVTEITEPVRQERGPEQFLYITLVDANDFPRSRDRV